MFKIRTLILLLSLFSLESFGQKIIKRSFFAEHGLGLCQDTTEMVQLSYNPAESAINVYSWTGIYGTVDLKFPNGEKPKKAKAKVGKFLLEQTAVNAANNNPNVKAPDIACLAKRKLTFGDIMTMDDFGTDGKGVREFYKAWSDKKLPFDRVQHQTVYPRPFLPGVEYFFEQDDRCGQSQVKPSTIKLTDPAGLAVQFPELGLGVTENDFDMVYKGEGLLGLKNRKNYVTRYQLSTQVDSVRVQLVRDVQVERPQEETVSTQLEEYALWDHKDAQLVLDDHTHFALLRGDKSGDKWSMYNHYRLVQFNEKGDLVQQTDCTTEFLRNVSFFSFTYDKSGKPAGILAIFSNISMVGAKSRRDPNDNNHELWYFGLDGKEKYHYTFTHGDKDNPRGMNPVLVLDNNGALEMLGINLVKLFKGKLEIVNFDSKGLVSASLVEEKGAAGAYSLPGYGKYTTTEMLEDGNFMITERTPKGDGAESGTTAIAVISPDLKVVAAYYLRHEKPEVPKVDYLGKFDGDYKFVITHDNHNYFISRGANRLETVLPAEEDKALKISKSMLGHNYVVDKDARKIYSFYEHGGGNGLAYVVVLEF